MSISHTDIIIVFELCFWQCPWKDEHENNTPHGQRHAYLHVELQSKMVFCFVVTTDLFILIGQ